jgi:hypothetical protein
MSASPRHRPTTKQTSRQMTRIRMASIITKTGMVSPMLLYDHTNFQNTFHSYTLATHATLAVFYLSVFPKV